MKKIISVCLTIVICSSFNYFESTTIDIAESTLKIGALGEEVFYYGFSEGDQLIFNFEEINGKELKEIEILEIPSSSSKFMDYKSKKVVDKKIAITRTAIYKFRFSNSALTGRICKFKIQRIPATETSKDFNTCVYWRTIYDTTYTTEQERYLIRTDTSFSDFYSGNPQISSQNALNGIQILRYWISYCQIIQHPGAFILELVVKEEKNMRLQETSL